MVKEFIINFVTSIWLLILLAYKILLLLVKLMVVVFKAMMCFFGGERER